MPKPEECSKELHDIREKCWIKNSTERITIQKVCEELQEIDKATAKQRQQ